MKDFRRKSNEGVGKVDRKTGNKCHSYYVHVVGNKIIASITSLCFRVVSAGVLLP